MIDSPNKSRKTFATISGVAVVITLLLFWSYRTQQIREDERSRRQLEAEVSGLISSYKSGDAKTIDLSKIESFSWDRLYIFGPDTSLKLIQKRLGYSWRPSIPALLGADTSFNLLVFTYHGKVVRYVDYPRVLGEFSGAVGGTRNGYEPHEAMFVINEFGYILWADQ